MKAVLGRECAKFKVQFFVRGSEVTFPAYVKPTIVSDQAKTTTQKDNDE